MIAVRMHEQMVFEEYGFASFAALPAQPLSLRAWAAERPDLPAAAAGVGVVVDAGFSFTHAVPLCDGRVLWPSVRRINLGGKALTNYLKELVSYRWDVTSVLHQHHSLSHSSVNFRPAAACLLIN